MGGLTDSNPRKVFSRFKEHFNDLLHATITDSPLTLSTTEDRLAQVNFGTLESPIAAPLRTKPWHLYLGQVLEAVRLGDNEWRLRTLQYSYWIQEGPSKDDRWLFRYEYVSRERDRFLHPRHHVHIPLHLDCPKGGINLAKVHLPTGWVTIEELIRFIIHGIGVKPRNPKWDDVLHKSEQKFREWTTRSV